MPRTLSALLAATAVVAAIAVAAPAAAQADPVPAALTGHTLLCHQTYANFGPKGTLSGYGDSASWSVTIDTDGTRYDASGDNVPKSRNGGAMAFRHHRLTFTSGPFHNARKGWVLTGRYVPGGARMPHDPRPGRRFPLVLRSVTNRHSEYAPVRDERNVIARSFFYCR